MGGIWGEHRSPERGVTGYNDGHGLSPSFPALDGGARGTLSGQVSDASLVSLHSVEINPVLAGAVLH